MESRSLPAKVGLFVLVGLVVIAALIVNFSKGSSFWRRGRVVIVKSDNVGGLRVGAAVTMSGVRVGSVEHVRLAPDGRSVLIDCRILTEVAIHNDARFEIEQSGFLGDQYVAIIPTKNAGPALKDGDVVRAEEPFNLQEAARGAIGLMSKLDAAATKIDSAVGRVDRVLLSETSLDELTNTIVNLRRMSATADRTLAEVEALVASNRPAIGATLSNLNAFSTKLSQVSDRFAVLVTNVDSVVVANREPLHETLLSLRDASAGLKGLAADLQAGHGTVGALLKDEALKAEVAAMVGNLNTVSSNLAKFGILYKPRQVRPLTNDARYPGRNPFR